jgi:hypothetical protein
MLVRQLPLLRPTRLLLGVGLVAVAGCSSSAASDVVVTHPTMIEVSPTSFLGDVLCATDGAGLKRYVATLFDTNEGMGGASGTADDAVDGAQTVPFQLPSSVATSCVAAVGFGFVVPGRSYRVEIDGYDTDALTARALGARQQVANGDAVQPSWQAACERAIAVDSTIIRADQCSTFSEATDPSADGSVSIKLAPLLGGLRCGSGEGEVEQLTVSLSIPGDDDLRTQSVACSDDATVVFDHLPPRQLVTASVTASAADSSAALAGATCTARTLPAAVVGARCGALSQVATVRLDLPAALGLLDVSCRASDLTSVEIKVPGQDRPQVVTPPACLLPFDQAFAPGPAAVTLTVRRRDAGGAPVELGSLTCHADAVAGSLVVAACEPNPAE